jgi:hypothetical protein
MSIQRNIEQQLAEIRANIEVATSLLPSEPAKFTWLTELLKIHGLSPAEGILVRLLQTPEQAGDLFAAVWLTKSMHFWSFVCLISRQSGELLEVEQAEEISHQFPVIRHQPGVGKSFGAVALEVLHAQYC